MADLPVRRHARSWLPAWSDLWSDLWTGFPSLAAARPSHLIRLEDEIRDGHYLVRAELPGIDPEKDVDVTVCNGELTIKAERSEKKEVGGHSEFAYGSFTRSITLPQGANEDTVKATYDRGILTVDVELPQAAATTTAEKHIKVETVG
ncbi:MAG: Hsp20/alpha crystallin family protein [Mycobacterium sp.]|nr:MAG: Hsp20/alpha crystallin family protein [Mycobacterium sp.]